MSESGLSVEEEVLSPDIFSEADTTIASSNPANSDESTSFTDIQEPEPSDDIPEWKGVSMDEIRKGQGIYDCPELPPIVPSASHSVLILLPVPAHGPPKPYPSHQVDKWSQGYVRMPHSAHSVYPVDQNGGKNHCRNRWEIIQESLLRSFISSQQLESAILTYNHIYAQRWDFGALHHFFTEVVEEEEANIFFEKLLPKMVQLALQLPVLITGAVPLLKRHTNKSISLSQLQVASLLANAFFCTFPRRNSTNPQSEYATYPYINFNRLYSAFKAGRPERSEAIMEKLKCLFHYFRRVTTKAPEGVITIQRRYIPKQDCPKWDKQSKKLPLLHIRSKGTIETDGAGLLQVDFANKYLGGGVLGLGCVQEEIRFAICPELFVTMLVTEALDDTEALTISGIERYSRYEGYSNTFKWVGDYTDETPRDSSGRKLTSIVAIDAMYFKNAAAQFNLSNITRELNKAYVGFIGCENNNDNLPAAATGNWGCGAFHGNPKLKVLLQLMAAGVSERSLVYFTFGDTRLRDEVADMYWHLVSNNVDVAHLFSLLVQYQEFATRESLDFYQFLFNRSKVKPLTKYFSVTTKIETKSSTKQPSAEEGFSWSKQNVLKKSKSFQTDNKRTFQTSEGDKPQNEEEERIQSWLSTVASDSKAIERPDQLKTNYSKMKNLLDEYADKNQNDADSQKKKKHPFWMSMETNTFNKSVHEERLSGLESFDSKQDLISTESNSAQEIASKTSEQPVTSVTQDILNKDEENWNTTNKTDEPIKSNTPIKKTSQKKISDFFQRTS